MKYLFVLGRNPELSKAEIYSYLEKNNIQFKDYEIIENGFLIEIEKELNCQKVIDELGGCLALGKVIVNGNEKKFFKEIEEKEIYFEKEIKFNYSIIEYSEDEENDIVQLVKDKFRQERLKAVYKNIRGEISVQNGNKFAGTRLNSTDMSYFFFRGKDWNFGILEGFSDSKEIEKRDMNKPFRREKLAISPRLAKILINLSQVKKGEKLADPFCGIGVILQEALLQDINVIGIEIDKEATEHAEKNLEWLKRNYNFQANWKIMHENSKRVGIDKIEGVACEPSLGQLLKKVPEKEVARQMLVEFENLMIAVLRNISRYLKNTGKIAFTSPLIQTHHEKLSCNIARIAESSGLKLYSIRDIRFPIREYRKEQVVGREIVVLVK